MFPDTPEPKSKHPVPALGARKLAAMSGRLKALGVGNTERYITWEARAAASCGGY